MEKIYNLRFDETYYNETLSNGLEVTIFHKPEFKTTACTFGTKFGALNIHQNIDGVDYHFNPGVAHFLEHKLFEAEECDIMLAFNSIGANVNAFTSYDSTIYYFTTTNKEFDKPLNLLLDFVQSLNITDKSVEKEKGIIIEELKMYMNMSDVRLINESYASLYKTHPLRHDIGGTTDSVTATTKQELENCYRFNYHPSNMKLVIATAEDPNKVIEIIRNNQNNKNFEPRHNVETIYDEKTIHVNEKYKTINMDVSTPKISYAIKLGLDGLNDLERIKFEWALQILLEMHFTSINPDYQSWIDNKIITDLFWFEVDSGVNYKHIIFYNETNDDKQYEEFIKLELDKFKSMKVDKNLLSQIKKRFLGLSYRVFNDIEDIAINHLKFQLNNINYFDVIDIIVSINYEYIIEVLNNITFDNYSITIIKK